MRTAVYALLLISISGCKDYGPANVYATCIDKITAPTSEQIIACQQAAETYKALSP